MTKNDKTPENQSFPRRAFGVILHNFWLKVLSLVFAVIISFIVRIDRDVTFDRVAKVKIVTLPDMVVVGPQERFIDVLVRQQNTIFSSPPTDFELTGEIDVLSETPGKVRVRINKDNFRNLPKQYVLLIDRPFLELEVDRYAQKKIPVKVNITGKVKTGFSVEAVSVVPSEIKISGPEQMLKKVRSISTAPVNIEDMDTNLIADTDLEEDSTTALSFSEKTARISITIQPRQLSRIFHSVPVQILGVSKNLLERIEYWPQNIDVEVSGPKDVINKINLQDIVAFVKDPHLKPGENRYKVSVELPDSIMLINTSPEEVSLHLNP